MKMKKDANVLNPREFRHLSLKELEGKREFIRDVHFTIHNSLIKHDFEIKGCLYDVDIARADPSQAGVEYVEKLLSFVVCDDPRHSYFFDWEWPKKDLSFLREQDIIFSNIIFPDMRDDNLKKSLDILKAEDASFNALYSENDIKRNKDLQDLVAQIKEKICDYNESQGIAIKTAIDSLSTLKAAIYHGDERTCEVVGQVDLLFTKALKRTDGTVVEMFNHIQNAWQICTNDRDASNLNIFSIYQKDELQIVQ